MMNTAAPLLRPDPPIPILLFHSVAADAKPRLRWVVHPTTFAAQMAYLRAYAYTAITVSQLASAMMDMSTKLPSRPVVITFDDGYADFYTNVVPILQDNGFVATLYVATAFVGMDSCWLSGTNEGERPMLSWTQLRELDRLGIECGSHGHLHLQLDALPREEAMADISHAQHLLQEMLGRPVQSFAYPHGYYDDAVREMVQLAGHTSACGVKHAMSGLSDDRFALARIIIDETTDVARFAALLAGEGLDVAPTVDRLRTRVWRLARRSAAWIERKVVEG